MARFILDCEDKEIDKEALAAALSDEAQSDAALSAEIVFTDGAAMQKLNAEARGVDAAGQLLLPYGNGLHHGIFLLTDRYF